MTNEVKRGEYSPVYSFYMSQFVGIPEAYVIPGSAPDTGDENLVFFTTAADQNVVSIPIIYLIIKS